MNVLSWSFGILAVIAFFCTFQQKKRKRLLLLKMCADACWVGHYACLGATGGMITNCTGAVRELTYSCRETHQWANHPILPIAFILVNWGLGIATYSSPIQLLPIAASTCVTVSLWLCSVRLTKLLTLPVCVMYLIYNILVGSIIGSINESLAILSILISFGREAIGRQRRKI